MYTGVGSYLWVARHEGRDVARRRLPLLGLTTAVAGVALAAVARFTPSQWWNYLLIPGSAYEWYSVAAWFARRREAGGVRLAFRRPPSRSRLVMLAALALLGGVMDLREGGISLSALFLVGLGASNVAVFLAVERARPGVVRDGVLLFDRFIPWAEIETWRLQGGNTRLELCLKGVQRDRLSFDVWPTTSASIAGVLDEHLSPLAEPLDTGSSPPASSR